MTKTTVYWTAKNNSSYLNGIRQADSIRAAVRDARRYVRNDLFGEGKIYYYDSLEKIEQGRCLRIDECSIFTGHNWTTR